VKQDARFFTFYFRVGSENNGRYTDSVHFGLVRVRCFTNKLTLPGASCCKMSSEQV